jgi:hypothetical protein
VIGVSISCCQLDASHGILAAWRRL